MIAKRIAVLTLWRDSAADMQHAMAQYEWLEDELIPRGYRFLYAFLENDSTDATAVMLYHWLRSRKGFLITEQVGTKHWDSVQSIERTQWLATYRNKCLKLLDYWDFDYLLVADSDVHYRPDLIERMVDHLDENPTWGMITPNTVQDVIDAVEETGLPSYYDSWALRDADGVQAMTFASNPFVNPDDRKEWEADQPVCVRSAFGSIALIRGEALEEDVEWNGDKGCEHWGLCDRLRYAGYEIWVDPTLHAEIKHKEEVKPAAAVVELHKERLKQFTEHTISPGTPFSMTFGISTNYANYEHLIKCVQSIRQQKLDQYEILLIGPEVPPELKHEILHDDVTVLTFNESLRPNWITKKKNLLAQHATFDRLCILHDYLWLTPDWSKGLIEFEKENRWSVLALPQQRIDGGRFWYDWSGFKGPRHLDNRQFYEYEDWSHNDEVYISGNIFCVHRGLLLDHPFDESLGHMEEEDLEWSKRISPYVHFKCAYNSLVCHQKEHRDQKFFLQLDQK